MPPSTPLRLQPRSTDMGCGALALELATALNIQGLDLNKHLFT